MNTKSENMVVMVQQVRISYSNLLHVIGISVTGSNCVVSTKTVCDSCNTKQRYQDLQGLT